LAPGSAPPGESLVAPSAVPTPGRAGGFGAIPFSNPPTHKAADGIDGIGGPAGPPAGPGAGRYWDRR